MKRELNTLALVLALLVASPLAAQHGGGGGEAASAGASVSHGAMIIEDLDLHLVLAGMKEAGAPRVIRDHLVLSSKGPYRYVAAAFASEGYTKLHPFDRNAHGVFILAIPVPVATREPLAYRLVVDGAWMADPRNAWKARTREGIEISLAELPYLSDEKPGLYHIVGEDGRTARFLFKGEPGLNVTVAGSFDNWDPFLYEMEETRPGVYELSLALPAGRHYYAFYYDGSPHPDPLNQDKATSRDGIIVSMLDVPGTSH